MFLHRIFKSLYMELHYVLLLPISTRFIIILSIGVFRHHPFTCSIFLSFIFNMQFIYMIFYPIYLCSNIKSPRCFTFIPLYRTVTSFMPIMVIISKIIIRCQFCILQSISHPNRLINNNNFCIINPLITTTYIFTQSPRRFT